jgi:2'-5' RNA ligase
VRVSIALLAEDAFQQTFQVRRDAISREYEFTPDNHGFWPHVSLKLPFVTTDLAGVSALFQEFAATVPPLTLTLTGLDLWTVPAGEGETGVLFLNVAEQKMLASLHERLNQGLTLRFDNTQAPFDGAAFHFHLTLAVGGASVEVYRRILETERRHWPACECRINAISLASQDDAVPEKGWQFGEAVTLPYRRNGCDKRYDHTNRHL